MPIKKLKSVLAGLLLTAGLLGGCAGGSLFRPTPLIGRDRLIFRVVNNAENVTYYTRNVWYDGENYRFHDVYGRDVTVLKSEDIAVDIISAYDYYQTP
jgi:hypothetical protein